MEDVDQSALGLSIDERLFRLLITSIKDYAIFMISPEGYILSWNKGAEHIKGYSEDEITGKHISVFYLPDDIQNNEPFHNLNEAIVKGSHESEGWRVRKGGSLFWASVVHTALYDDNKKLLGFTTVTRDITNRKKNEDKKAKLNTQLQIRIKENTEKILASEQRFTKLIKNSYDGIALLDKSLHVFFRSFSAERINGWNDIERGEHTFEELTHPDDIEGFKKVLNEVLARPGIPSLTTYRVKHRLGHYIWVEALYTNMLDDIHINAIVCNFRDVTAKKKADEEIRKKTEQIEDILERITDGFIALDNDLCYTYANKRIGEMTGYNPASLIGLNVWDKFPDAIGSETYKAFHTALREQRYICHEDYYAPLNLWQENHIYPSENGLSVFIRDITQKKKADAELNKKTEQIESILERITDGFVALDNSFHFTYANKKMSDMVGYPAEMLIGKYIWDAFPDVTGSETYKAVNKAFTEQRYVCYEDYYPPTKLWQENHIYPSADGISVFVRDITERKKIEKRLHEASETQAAILNALPPHIALLNEKGKIIAVNEAWRKFAIQNNLGMPNYGVGYNYLAISEKATGVDRSGANKISQGIKDVISGAKKTYTMEYSCNLPAEIKWFQVLVGPLADKSHKGVVIVHIDITDRKLTEESMLRSEANLRSVFENTDLSIILFNRDLKTMSFNNNARQNMLRNLGVKLKTGKIVYNYFPKDRKAVIKQAIEKARNNEMASYQTTYKLLDGSIEWYEVKWVGVINRKMENIGVILTFNNITEKKNADIEREKIVAELVRRNKDLEQFTYIISHNLRAPVANIIGLAELTRGYEIRDKELREVLASMAASVKNLDNVIIDLNNILQISNNGNEPIQKVYFDDVVDSIKHGINNLIKKQDITIVTHFTSAPSFATLRSYLYSILHNLIINSIKYRQPNVPLVINISTSINNDKLLLNYADNGKGIDLKKNGPYLFGLYRRFDFTVEGKGMGLFMVKIQVENLGGSIKAKSELNKGLEFTMEFPNHAGS